MNTLKVTKVSPICTVTIKNTKMTMRRPSDARKKEARGGLRRTLIMSMKSSSRISSPELDNKQMVILLDRPMLHNKINTVMGSISIHLEALARKSRVMEWNFMAKMFMCAWAYLFTKHCTVLKRILHLLKKWNALVVKEQRSRMGLRAASVTRAKEKE